MTFPRHTPISRAVITVLMLFGWIIATNHCALGLMQQSSVAKVDHASCCNGKPEPAKDGPVHGGVRECCKAIHAVPAPDGKVLAKDDSAFSVAPAIALPASAGNQTAAPESPAATHEHDPPRAGTFAELVLHRSLRSHAPPIAA